VLRGAIVGESLRVGARIDGVPLTVRKVERVEAGGGRQPPAWTLLWFEVADEHGERLADALAGALAAEGGWYADFHSDSEVTVVFADRVFRYRKGDAAARAEVEAHARSVGVPDPELDWAE
jgi:hypothetical protein